MSQNSEINSKREDVEDGFSEDTQMDEPGEEEMVEKQKPKGKKTPEELLAGKLLHKMLNIQQNKTFRLYIVRFLVVAAQFHVGEEGCALS